MDRIGVFLFLLLFLFSACQNSQQVDSRKSESGQRIAILALFDISESTADIRAEYRHTFLQVLEKAANDDKHELLIRGTQITKNTEATASFPIDVTLERSRGVMEQKLPFEEKRKKEKEKALQQLDRLLQQTAEGSDIMSSFRLAKKVFDSLSPVSRKVLIVFSDMVEQTDEYNFTDIALDDAAIAKIIEKEKAQHRFPNLSGVEVWVTGFARSSTGGLPQQTIVNIERFWTAYFSESGASLKSMMPQLVNFRL